MITNEQKLRFDTVCREVLTSEHELRGIGTLGERTLHVILKKYFEPDRSLHAVKVGRFVADIKKNDEITEIQTRSFGSMRKKLEVFTNDHRVNIVFPIAASKHLSWVNPESGELTSWRKSPKRGQPWDILYEMYALRPMMPLRNVRFTLVFMNIEEYKLLDGWSHDKKRGAHRYERIPTEFVTLRLLISSPIIGYLCRTHSVKALPPQNSLKRQR